MAEFKPFQGGQAYVDVATYHLVNKRQAEVSAPIVTTTNDDHVLLMKRGFVTDDSYVSRHCFPMVRPRNIGTANRRHLNDHIVVQLQNLFPGSRQLFEPHRIHASEGSDPLIFPLGLIKTIEKNPKVEELPPDTTDLGSIVLPKTCVIIPFAAELDMSLGEVRSLEASPFFSKNHQNELRWLPFDEAEYTLRKQRENDGSRIATEIQDTFNAYLELCTETVYE